MINKRTITGTVLIVCAVCVFIFVAVRNSDLFVSAPVFSEKGMLESLWHDYKVSYIEEGTGRALDKDMDNITTSEGQSYTLLRAVWIDDKPTFDLALKWTVENLARKEDHLSSWLFGKKADGTYGVLTDRGGYNSATDADTDIALALIFAERRWGDGAYGDRAQDILKSVWEKSVVIVKGVPYLAANNLEKVSSQDPIVNPSYLSPYAYRIFADFDKEHDWMALVDSSYAVLEKSSSMNLDKGSSSGLPPDWIAINRTTGEPQKVSAANLTTNFSYDALRTPWRVALDYQWFKEPRAKSYLDKLGFLNTQWQERGKIVSVYSHEGSIVSDQEAPATYGGTIGYFLVSNPEKAKEVYEQKLKSLYSEDENKFNPELSYYDANWVWFGMGLYNDLLPNLAKH